MRLLEFCWVFLLEEQVLSPRGFAPWARGGAMLWPRGFQAIALSLMLFLFLLLLLRTGTDHSIVRIHTTVKPSRSGARSNHAPPLQAANPAAASSPLAPTLTFISPALDGYCDTTVDGQGERCETYDTKGTWRLSDEEACISRCATCNRCHFVSFSRRFSDCSWFRRCDLSALKVEQSSSHASMQVRSENGSVCRAHGSSCRAPGRKRRRVPDAPDLNRAGVFERTLARCASSNKDIILLVADGRHANWAHNFILNLRQLDIGHFLIIASSAQSCRALDVRVNVSGRCGFSSWLRRGHNASIDAGLSAYGISDGHVYHLWWQRVHYMARAVGKGYATFIMDTDVSLRADPYPVLRGPMQHRQLIFGLDNDWDGRRNLGEFPGINCGFIYCSGRVGGAAHVLIERWAARIESLLLGPVVRNTEYTAVFHMLFDQDTWKDVLETAAFQPPPSSYRASEFVNYTLVVESFRHVMYYAALSPPELQPLAKEWAWRHEQLVVHQGQPAEDVPWLPLHHSRSEQPAESMAGLPYSVFSGYNCDGRTGTPQGNRCDGGWAVQPSPIMVGHLVGTGGKFFLMRLLGWWHSQVDEVAVAAPSGGELLHRRVFPPGVRLLVLRRHSLRVDLHGADDTWSLIVRFIFLAFVLGRRAVLPSFPCELTAALYQETSPFDVAPLANESMCDVGARQIEWLPEISVPPRWTSTAAAERTSRRKKGVPQACCQPVPRDTCIDGTGTHRHLHEELILHERDHALLLSELHPAATRRVHTSFAQLLAGNGSIPTDPDPNTPVVVLDAREAPTLDALPSYAQLARWLSRSRAFKRLSSELPQLRGCVRDLRARLRV